MTEACKLNEYLNLTLQIITENSLAFRGFSIITSGKLPYVMGRNTFQPPKDIGFNSLRGNLCF